MRLPVLLGGRNCILVTFPEARGLGLVERVQQLVGEQLHGVIDTIAPNPDIQWLGPLYEQVQREYADAPVIVALGGGSAIDSAKGLLCATPNGKFEELLEVLEQGGRLPTTGATIAHKALIAIPTTAGTGSEVTPWAPDHVVAGDELTAGGRPGPYMALANVLALGISDVRACVKVDDTVPGIEEGLNAGMWTIGLSLSGNEVGYSKEEYSNANAADVEAKVAVAEAKLKKAGSHYVMRTIADLPAVLAKIAERMRRGELPTS